MATAQNIIHSSSFNFEYADKAAARRGNDLVESIFESQILPEIEKAISNKIPDEVQIELSKLEINIGTIEEKEMSDKLPTRVRESLERALNFNFSRELNGKSLTRDVQKPDKLFIQSLEMFFVKGFFPFGIEKSVTVDELVQRILSRDDVDFSEILLRHRNQKQVVERISYNLNVETFDKILTAQDPVNSNWIIEFRKILMYLKKELNLNQYSDSEFIKMMNSSILEYMLNETSLTFSKEKFSANMVTRVIEIFNPDIDLLSQAINKFKGNNAATFLINKSLNQLQNKKYLRRVQDKNQQLSIDQLLELLNSGDVDFDSENFNFLKAEIVLVIQDKTKRERLAEQLTASGSSLLLEIFNPGREKNLFKLIGSFAKNIAVKFQQEISGEQYNTINQLVLDTILYLHETSFRKLDNEEFILYLISSAGLDLSKIKSSAEFQHFVQLEGKVRKGKMASVIDEEKHFSEISDIHKILSESGKQPKKDFQIVNPDSYVGDEYSKIYKRKIGSYFLTNGYLPEAFFDLSLQDVQILFTELVQLSDDFLAAAIRKKDKSRSLMARLKTFISFVAPEDLETYFIHFFREEYAALEKITDEIIRETGWDDKSYLESKPIKNEIFMQALVESGGENLQSVFWSVALEFLFAERTKDFRIPENLPKLFEAEPDKNRIKTTLEQNLKLLVNSFLFSDTGVQLAENTLKTTVQQIAFYARLSPQLFQESIQKFKDEQELIFTILKFYLPDNQWKSVSKILSPLVGFENFQQNSDLIFKVIAQSNLSFKAKLKSINESAPQSIKTFLLLAKNDKNFIEEFDSEEALFQVLTELPFENKTFERHLTALSTFSPGTFSGKLTAKFWRLTIADFGILVFAEEKKITPATFAKSIMSHLLQKLKSVQRMELYYPIIEKMQNSGFQELTELVELWKASERSDSIENDKVHVAGVGTKKVEPGKLDSIKELEQNFRILKFYVQHGFFPWWANQLTFPEIVSKLYTLCREFPGEIEEMFLQAEKESQIFEKLANRIPESAWFEIDRLISRSQELKARWEEVLQNKKNSSKVTDEPRKQNSLNKLEQNFHILEFYVQHGFLPSSAGPFSFPEVINKLQMLAGKVSGEIEEMFLRAEKESQIFEKLANRIPESAWFEIDRLISHSQELKAKWEEVLQNKKTKSKIHDESGRVAEKTKGQSDINDIDDFLEKAAKDSELLFKGLYNLTDDQILNQWLKENHEITAQIKPYLQLGPYFYFKNTTPVQWREAVYRFSLPFYRNDLKRSKSEFHAEFLKFIRRQYPHVNWDEVLKSVWLTIHRSGKNQKAIFPAAMARLLNLKPEWLHREKVPDKKPESVLSEEEEGLGVKIYNAGIILFWPFLTRFFETLSFLKNGVFVNDEFRNRAVYLIQYLAFYRIDFPEYELVLNKLLTGMLTEDHLEPFVTLTDEEKTLTTSLLYGLINNWEKVKNSTPEGIQETFLQREGILRFKREEVFLEVEKKGVDILVKSIPWNISLIKLPWMKKPMHVEWV